MRGGTHRFLASCGDLIFYREDFSYLHRLTRQGRPTTQTSIVASKAAEAEVLSLSIDETNALRLKIGLPPLRIQPSATTTASSSSSTTSSGGGD